MAGIAFLLAYFSFQFEAKKRSFDLSLIDNLSISLGMLLPISFILGGFFSSFLYPNLLFSFWDRFYTAGFTYLLGLLVYYSGARFLSQYHQVDWSQLILAILPSIILCNCFGRIGCSLAGCCFGELISFDEYRIHFPAREIEVIFSFFYYAIYRRFNKANLLILYLPCYSILRFCLEFYRGDDRGMIPVLDFLSPSQVFSIILLIITLPKRKSDSKFMTSELPPPWARSR